MAYLVTFLEGIITFISPCLLPMLPVYIAYFAGSSNALVEHEGDTSATTRKTFVNALGFVLGFTLVFVLMGAFAGTLGSLLRQYQTAINIVCGVIVIILGLNFMGIIHIGFLDRTLRPKSDVKPLGFFPAVLFGIIFAIGWTPCVGAFLGSALLLASQQGSLLEGIFLLLVYSLGLGVPFILSALAIEKLGAAFDAIKRHYRVITMVCGGLLVVVGLLMAFGLMGSWLRLLSI